MKLPFFNRSSKKKESYVGILLQQNKALGYVYELSNGQIMILGQQAVTFSNGLQNIVEDIDDLLFRLETDTNRKLSKTIFFVTAQYLDLQTKEIKKEYKNTIKTIAKELDLHPLGFIECYEAVAALLGRKEGLHLNAVLVELDGTLGNVFIYKNDKQIFSATFERTDDIVHDLTKIFIELSGDFMLPSRIVLYPFAESHKELVHLVNHRWSEDLFAQIPKIETLSEDHFHEGLADIFASQMQDVDDSASRVVDAAEEEEFKPATPALSHVVDATAKQEQPHEVMGFVIGSESTTADAHQKEDYQEPFHEDDQKEKKGLLSVLPSFKVPHLIKLPIPGRLQVLIPAILIGIIVVLAGSELLLHKETIKVIFPTKQVSQSTTISNDDVTIKTGSISSDVSDSIATTGKRDIGEKAHGEVTIRSFDDKEKTFPKGTILTADGKKFILDQDVKVASASVSDDGSAKIAGQAKGNVVADTIGPESNLDKGKKFQVGDFSTSTYSASNDAAFTGGTKRQAQTVAKKDMDDLKAKVLAAGKKQGLDKMRKDVSADQQIINDITEQELDNVVFSKEVGDEAKELSVKATVQTVYHTYSENNLKHFLQKSLQRLVADGYTLPLDKIIVTITKATQKDESITLSVMAQGNTVKQVSKEALIDAVKGKSKANAKSILQTQFGAQSSTFEDNGVPIFPWLPLLKSNISIQINST